MSAKKHSPSPEARAEDFLKGRTRVRAAELVALIHDINPTGRELASEVGLRRYALKSKLQSLLVRQFPDDVTVEPVSEESGVVGLRYRPEDRDACHAVIAELDEDARSWVRLALDLGESQLSEPGPVVRASARTKAGKASTQADGAEDAPGLLRLGREALEAYDFERSRDCFERALEASEGGAAAATALLELLVEHLAAYDDALACQRGLSAEALEDSSVRGLLATAAAQLGQAETCVELLKNVEGPRAADAWVLLAKAALAQGELALTGAHLQQARRLAPAHGDIVALGEALQARRADARRPAEAQLEQLAAAGDDAATQAQAHRLLAQWPDSPTARRVLRELEGRQQAAQAQALSREGQQAFEARDFARAGRLWAEAQALGAAGLAARIAQAAAADEASRREARLAAAVRALKGGVEAASLARYQGLEAAEREEVRAGLRLPVLEWLELLGRGGGEGEADVATALALVEASALEASTQPERVLSLLEPFEARLRRVPHGVALLTVARASREERRLEQARQALDEARGAFEAGELQTAVRLAEQLVLTGPADVKAAAEQLGAQARRPLEAQRRREHFAGLLQADRLVEALDVVGEAELDSSSAEQAHWRESRQALAARLGRQLKVEVHRGTSEGAAVDCSELGSFRDDVIFGLTDAGETFYAVATHGPELFIREMSVADLRVRTLVALRPPEAMDFPRAHVEGDTLCVSASSGAVLELSLADWGLRSWRGSAGLHAPEEVVEQELLVPGTRFLWLSLRTRGGGGEFIRVFDVERRRQLREVTGGLSLTLVPGPGGPRVFASGFQRDGRLYAPAGNPTLSIPAAVGALAGVPGQAAFVGFARAGAEDEEVLELTVVDAQGRRSGTLALAEAWADSPHTLATSHRASLSFALYQGATASLAAYEVRQGAPCEVWRLEAPSRACLIQDVHGAQVVLSFPGEGGPTFALLGRSPPTLRPPDDEADELPLLSESRFCGGPPANEAVEKEVRALKEQPSEVARARALEAALESRGGDALALVQLASRLRAWDVTAAAERAASVARAKFPAHPQVRLDEAEECAKRQDWARAIDRLGGLDAELDTSSRAHVHHLRGLALYHLGRFEEARLEFQRCAAVPEGQCRVAGWPGWLEALERPSGGAAGARAPAALRLLAAIREADAALEAGDGARAQALLDTPLGWRRLETQVAGRLAEAVLLQPDVSGERRFRKRLILAAFVDTFDERRSYRGSLPLGPAGWSEERLEALGRRAREWLEGV